MLTTDMEILDISSEEPLTQAFSRAGPLKLVLVRPRALVLGRLKYSSGRIPPTTWLRAVAMAAPSRPHRNTATNRASSAMLVMPAATVTARPSWGFSAVTKKLWNSYCSIKAGRAIRMMRP